ncbi:MAG: restriction endonuclease [Thermofilaceae archaeon]
MVETVVKANGSREPYSREKLLLSVVRCGLPEQDALKLVEEVEESLPAVVTSDEIYSRLLARLRERYPQCAVRYAVRRAIMRMGPEGYPFEKFVARLLEKMGYATRTNVKARGRCIEHELDVVAEGRGERFFVECKYHNLPGIKVDAKVALYVYARYLDLKDQFDRAWIVTNTKVTAEAAAYAECVGMRVIAWHYPEEGLEVLIERYGLYPITVLSTLSEEQKRVLLRSGIVTLNDLAKLSASELAVAAGVSVEQAEAALAEAKMMELLQR